jgi:hypothetical protein
MATHPLTCSVMYTHVITIVKKATYLSSKSPEQKLCLKFVMNISKMFVFGL